MQSECLAAKLPRQFINSEIVKTFSYIMLLFVT